MEDNDTRVLSIIGIIFCLSWCGFLVWYVTTALKKGKIFRFARVPIGGSAFIYKKDNSGSFWCAVIIGYVLSAVLLCGGVMIFLSEYFPQVLK
jgi:hypothetical protein